MIKISLISLLGIGSEAENENLSGKAPRERRLREWYRCPHEEFSCETRT